MPGPTPHLLAASSSSSSGGSGFFVLLAVMVVAFFLLVIRPQRARAKKLAAQVAAIKVGAEVVTRGGLIGRVVALDDEVADVELAPGVTVRALRPTLLQRPSTQVPMDDADLDERGGDPI